MAIPGPCLHAHSWFLTSLSCAAPYSTVRLVQQSWDVSAALHLLLSIRCVAPVLGNCFLRFSDTQLVVTMGKMLEKFQMSFGYKARIIHI